MIKASLEECYASCLRRSFNLLISTYDCSNSSSKNLDFELFASSLRSWLYSEMAFVEGNDSFEDIWFRSSFDYNYRWFIFSFKHSFYLPSCYTLYLFCSMIILCYLTLLYSSSITLSLTSIVYKDFNCSSATELTTSSAISALRASSSNLAARLSLSFSNFWMSWM